MGGATEEDDAESEGVKENKEREREKALYEHTGHGSHQPPRLWWTATQVLLSGEWTDSMGIRDSARRFIAFIGWLVGWLGLVGFSEWAVGEFVNDEFFYDTGLAGREVF